MVGILLILLIALVIGMDNPHVQRPIDPTPLVGLIFFDYLTGGEFFVAEDDH